MGTFALFIFTLVYIHFMNNAEQTFQYFVGPLNLDKRTNQATTVTGVKLALNAGEFNALDILAEAEDTLLTLEQIYSALREKGNDSYELETARLMLDNLVRQVNESGEGFMWIEHDPKKGYTFKTRWGHNWRY